MNRAEVAGSAVASLYCLICAADLWFVGMHTS